MKVCGELANHKMHDLKCPNDPPCPHLWHDIEDYGDPVPMCCHEDCTCGKTPADKAKRDAYFNDESGA